MSYDSLVIADAPWVFLTETETSGTTLADSSGNSRPMTTTGTPTLNQSGPAAGVPSINFVSGSRAVTAANVGGHPTTSTYECWVYLTATPSSALYLLYFAPTVGVVGPTSGMQINTAGKVLCDGYNGSGTTITAPSALTLNTWHHVVVSTGAAGKKIRIDKVTVASSGTTSDSNLQTCVAYIHGIYNGSTVVTSTDAVKIAKPAMWFNVQLSDAATDAHYDAMIGSDFLGTGTFTGSGTLSSTGAPAATGATATLSGSGTLGATGVADSSFAGTGTLGGSGTLSTTGTPAIGRTVALSGSGSLAGIGVVIVPIVIAGEPFTLPILATTGLAGAAVGTDTGPDPSDPDPSTGVDGTGFGKWTFIDPQTSETYVFDTNPNAMDGVHRQLSINPMSRSAVTPVAVINNSGPVRVTQGKRQPLEWSFSGNIRSREHYMAMRKWSHKHYRIVVVDHFGRKWSVQLQGIQYEEQKPNPHRGWRFRYVARCILYGRLS